MPCEVALRRAQNNPIIRTFRDRHQHRPPAVQIEFARAWLGFLPYWTNQIVRANAEEIENARVWLNAFIQGRVSL